jgi:RNA polymerase sigma-70 factor (ECF subfamily)
MGEMTASTQQTRDELLALRCQTGAAGAFAELVREMERPLLYFVAKVAGEPAALDVLQDVWLKAFRTIDRLAEPKRLRPWLYRLARGLAIDRVRKTRADALRESEHARELEGAGAEPTFDADDAAAIHRALDALPLPLREVLVLHFLEELPLAEVAAVVGCPEGTVKSRLHAAKRALRAVLGGP